MKRILQVEELLRGGWECLQIKELIILVVNFQKVVS